MVTVFWAGLRQHGLLDMQVERLVLDLRSGRTHADQAGALELEIRNDVLHDRAGSDRPFLGMLVVGVHVPVVKGFVAGPETDLVMPCRILGTGPPGEGGGSPVGFSDDVARHRTRS